MLCLTATSAWAQAPRLPAFRPDFTTGLVYDDNVFRRPTGETVDLILRVSPGFELKHESTRLTLGSNYRFDAERFQDHPTLSAVLARQVAGVDLTFRPINRTSFGVRAGYHRTQTAHDLNQTTGISGGRQLASRREFSGDLSYAFRPNRDLTLGYDYGYDAVVDGIGSELQGARARYHERFGGRNDLSLTYRVERREFLPGPQVYTHVGLLGWTHRLTPALSFTAEAGPRWSGDELRPDVTVSLSQRMTGLATLAVTYTHTQGVAVGVGGLVEIDSLASSVALRRGNRWEVILGASGYRNLVLGSNVLVYDVSGSVGRSLGRSVWLVGSATTSLNDSTVTGTTVFSEQIRRNAISLSLRVAPWSAPR
jgi:hypothetical protein